MGTTQTALDATRETLCLRNYSPKTREAYLRCLRIFLEDNPNDAVTANPDSIKRFLLARFERGSASQTVSLYFNAIKFYYHTVRQQHFSLNWRTPKRPQRLPTVLSRAEISRLLAYIINKKTLSYPRAGVWRRNASQRDREPARRRLGF